MYKFLLIFCILGATWQFFSTRARNRKAEAAVATALAALPSKPARASEPSSATTAATAPTGFVFLAVPKNAPADKVLVISPPDAPPDATRRAEVLMSELRAASIPCVQAGHAAFSVATQYEAEAVNAFMAGPLPMVFINGKACANPRLAEVIAEYRRGTPK